MTIMTMEEIEMDTMTLGALFPEFSVLAELRGELEWVSFELRDALTAHAVMETRFNTHIKALASSSLGAVEREACSRGLWAEKQIAEENLDIEVLFDLYESALKRFTVACTAFRAAREASVGNDPVADMAAMLDHPGAPRCLTPRLRRGLEGLAMAMAAIQGGLPEAIDDARVRRAWLEVSRLLEA